MFFRFAPSTKLDVAGMNGAKRFRKLFTGMNPLYRFGIWKRSRSREDLIVLIAKNGGYSCKEAEQFIRDVLGTEVRYEEKPKKIKRFILYKKQGAEEYYLVSYASKKLFFT
ncbi:MAG: hypothetical protein WAV46_03010 [Candidatus Moraniibacteriota bacterium]